MKSLHCAAGNRVNFSLDKGWWRVPERPGDCHSLILPGTSAIPCPSAFIKSATVPCWNRPPLKAGPVEQEPRRRKTTSGGAERESGSEHSNIESEIPDSEVREID